MKWGGWIKPGKPVTNVHWQFTNEYFFTKIIFTFDSAHPRKKILNDLFNNFEGAKVS